MEQENGSNEPAASPNNGPGFIGDTNITGQNNTANIYPEVSSPAPQPLPTSPVSDTNYKQTSSALNNAIVLVFGLGSSAGYFLATLLFKNEWVAAFVAILLAMTALGFALKEYESTGKMTPLQVLGLSGAGFTFVFVLDYLLIRIIISSAFRGLGD